MKVVLFCGGQGMRMREFSDTIPKPMVPVGPRPVLWHLMRYYAHHGHRDFVLCLGHRSEYVKRYFLDYEEWLSNDVVLHGRDGVELLGTDLDDWNITMVDTGYKANVGERLCAVREHLDEGEPFMVNYGDGLSDVSIDTLVEELEAAPDAVGIFLRVPPSQTFHVVKVDERGRATSFHEVADSDMRVNGGYFVFRPEFWEFIEPGEDLVEGPLTRLAEAGRLIAHDYDGFWMGMDTFKDREVLNELHEQGHAPWEKWT